MTRPDVTTPDVTGPDVTPNLRAWTRLDSASLDIAERDTATARGALGYRRFPRWGYVTWRRAGRHAHRMPIWAGHSRGESATLNKTQGVGNINIRTRSWYFGRNMARAIAARTQGDDYQARFFWFEACRLFEPRSVVESISYENPNLKFFDDVSLTYKSAVPGERGESIWADHHQLKFHVDHSEQFSCDALLDPDFIGAKTSLLLRLRDFQNAFPPEPKAYRVYVNAPWGIRPDDPLGKLISTQGGEFRLHVLFDGRSDRTAMGKVRKKWRDHLQIEDDATLKRIVAPLRLETSYFTLNKLREFLNARLRLVGLKPVPDDARSHPYDDLIRKLHQAGRTEFRAGDLREICKQEGLLQGDSVSEDKRLVFGLRSFMRWAEHMEDETDHLLCLVQHFDNRNVRDPRLWNEAIIPEVRGFLSQMRPGSSYELQMDTHSSIAFLAGFFLPSKSGVDVIPTQKTLGVKSVWQVRPTEVPSPPQPKFWTIKSIPCSPGQSDVALALSATHDVREDVRLYVQKHLQSVGRILEFTIGPSPSSTAIRDGTHALTLAQAVESEIRKRTPSERSSKLHIFVAGPNAFVFFLGQLAHSFGGCLIYEYDFETNAAGAYMPAISLPPSQNS